MTVIDERGLEIINRRISGNEAYAIIASDLGISKTRASQIAKATFRKLIRLLGKNRIPDIELVPAEATLRKKYKPIGGPQLLYRKFVPYFDTLRPQLEALSESEELTLVPDKNVFADRDDHFARGALASYLRAYFPHLRVRGPFRSDTLRVGIVDHSKGKPVGIKDYTTRAREESRQFIASALR